jgi:hypothetical protein
MMQSNGTASYHSLQISARKSMSANVSFTAFYTFSKSLSSEEMNGQSTSGGAQDFNNLALEHGRSGYDQRHNFVAAIIWNLSYYRGSSSLLKHVLNGWTLSPIVTLTSGLPFTVTSGKDNNYDGNNNDRANVVADPYLNGGLSSQWFNTAAFVQNPIGTDGTSARNFLDAPGYRNIDMGIFRDLTLEQSVKLQFRAEFTNFFNMVSLNPPNANQSSTSFGQVTSAHDMRQLQLGLRLTF